MIGAGAGAGVGCGELTLSASNRAKLPFQGGTVSERTDKAWELLVSKRLYQAHGDSISF